MGLVSGSFTAVKRAIDCSYYANDSSKESHLDSLSKSIDSLSSKYDNFILLADFNSCMEDSPNENIWGNLEITKSCKRANMF